MQLWIMGLVKAGTHVQRPGPVSYQVRDFEFRSQIHLQLIRV